MTRTTSPDTQDAVERVKALVLCRLGRFAGASNVTPTLTNYVGASALLSTPSETADD